MKKRNYIFTLIIILLCVILLSTFICSIRNKEGFYGKLESNSVELVIARYNEPLDWLDTEPYNKYPVVIYNKGPNENFKHTDKIKDIVHVKNVGRCDHTFLYHVVKNYDNLADVTVFLPGSTGDIPEKIKASKDIISEVENKKGSYFTRDLDDVYETFYNFQLNDWKASHSKNLELNSESELTPANIRPFGEWFKSHFGDMKVKKYGLWGIFSIHKQHVLQHPVEYYQDLMKELEVSSNPEVGHYFERSWAAVFGPLFDI